MRGYRDLAREVGPLYRLLIRLSDSLVRMKIVRIGFREAAASAPARGAGE